MDTHEEVEYDLMELLYIIKSRFWIIIFAGIIGALAVSLYSSFMVTPSYTSKTQLYILSKTEATTKLTDIQVGSQLTQDYLILSKSRSVVNQVIENLYLDTTYEEIIGRVSVSNPNNTRILEIEVNYPNAFMAKSIADEFARVSAEQIANIMSTDKPTIVDEGSLPLEPSSPNVMKNAIIAGILAAILTAGIVIVLNIMDDTIKGSEDVEKYLNLSTLGLIPLGSGKKAKKKPKKKKLKKKKQKS